MYIMYIYVYIYIYIYIASIYSARVTLMLKQIRMKQTNPFSVPCLVAKFILSVKLLQISQQIPSYLMQL